MGDGPKLVGLFAFRFDEKFVPGLIKNLDFVDDLIIHDDRENDARWYHEGSTRQSLIARAREAGADWVLCMDPDERLERGAGRRIRELIKTDDDVLYGVRCREMWSRNTYRTDGVWGAKHRYTLFPLKDGQEFSDLPVHAPWHPLNPGYRRELTDLNLYHLKMIDPRNRTARKDLYNELDPERRIQRIGYDYLDDETGLELERIPLGRGYRPRRFPRGEIKFS